MVQKNDFFPIQTYLWLKEGNRGSSVMIWAGIVNQTIIEPFKVDERVKLNGVKYCDCMTFLTWYKSQSRSFKVKCVFILNNAIFHVFNLTPEFFEHKRFTWVKNTSNNFNEILPKI